MNIRSITNRTVLEQFQAAVLLAGCLLAAGFSPLTHAQTPSRHEYIGIDQIKPGDDAYCLTVLEGTKVEKFGLKVVSIMRDFEPGRDAFLVIGTDERFRKIGPVRGCSGSPVYIGEKLAGALAGGWSFSKEPLYIVTPIYDILSIGSNPTGSRQTATSAVSLDLSKPIDIAEFSRMTMDSFKDSAGSENSGILLATSLPSHVCKELRPLLEPMGFTPVAGAAAGNIQEDLVIEPGGVIAVPIVSGDIMVSAIGTAIEVIDDKVYAFGHAFPNLGYGPTDLPMAAGSVHAVVSSVMFSFKLASPGNIVGTIRANESTGIFGVIGQKPKTIPMKISVDRRGTSGNEQKKIFNCTVASHRVYSPIAIQSSLMGAAMMKGSLTPEHTVKYKARINIDGAEPIILDNISSGLRLAELLNESAGIVAMLMNNQFEETRVTSMEFDIIIEPKNIRAKIWSVEISDTMVKPEQTVDISVVLQTYRAEKILHKFKLDIPSDIEPGKYQVIIAGGYEYQRLLKNLSPHKYMAHNMTTLLSSLRNILDIKRNTLYMAMKLPSEGITIRENELPFLPQTKAMLMQDKKRTMNVLPYNLLLRKSIDIDRIVLDKATVQITVEK
jgi:hypothetical protein